MEQNIRYGIRLAVIYGIIWFIDLLDSTLLNVALPEVSAYFQIDPTNAEWALIGFLLAMTIGMIVSNPAGANFGFRPVFIGAQWLYIASSLACGLSPHFSELVIFRILQGFGGGLAIPIGMSMLMTAMPQKEWAKTGALLNIFALLAPALGPIFAGYITTYLDWRWLFFIKLPISLTCVLLTYLWVRSNPKSKVKQFDWFGFLFISISLSLALLVFSEVGKPLFTHAMLITLFILAILFGLLFVWQEKRTKNPIIPLKIFHFPLFSWGNLIQSAANMIFLGATFLVALYLQWGVGFTIITTGWMMAAITLGMATAMPFTAKYYNRIGPLPYIIVGLLLMSGSMFGLIFITKGTPYWVIALIIFCEWAGSASLQSTNFVSIFSEIPKSLKGTCSSLYSLFKQVSASFGIALSTMTLTLAMKLNGIQTLTSDSPQSLFYWPLILLGCIPLLALLCTFYIDNKKAIKAVQSKNHLETEFEE